MNNNITSEFSKNLPGTGDIRLRIETTKVNQSFSLFYRITTEEGGFISIDWGDGNAETLTDDTVYSPVHIYAEPGEYIVKLTGSKFMSVIGRTSTSQLAVQEILSLKMPADSKGVSLRSTFRGCSNLKGNIPAWDDCIVDASSTYMDCTSLKGNIPDWGANITNAYCTYKGCVHLTGNIPEWGEKIVDAESTYEDCSCLTGNIPAWEANIIYTYGTYCGCTSLTGSIPAWGTKIIVAVYTYRDCTGLTGCSAELLQDPMPSRITSCIGCIFGCADEIRQHFTKDWGGAK